jgi:DNA-binding LacI/PurR family transcriptional regulator
MGNISLGRLARLAGVSKTTASLILNGKWERYKISSVTKERVIKVAEEQGYKPNVLARNLSTGKSMIVGVIVPTLKSYEHSIFAELVEKELIEKGYHTTIGLTDNDEKIAGRLTEEMTERKVDGILAAGCVMPAKISDDIPYVFTGEGDDGVSSVLTDADAGVKKLIGYWYPRGKRTIGYAGLKNGDEFLQKSFRENYIERFSMKDDRIFLLDAVDDAEKMKKVLKALSNKGVNAVLFENPDLIFTALKVLKEHGTAGFEEMTFGSYGYSPFFDVAVKDIVCIKKPMEAMVKDAVAVLLEKMHDKKGEVGQRLHEPELLF